MTLVNIALYCSKAEIRVPVGGGGWWCKPIIVSNPQPSYFGLHLGWVAVAWLGFGVMTICLVIRYTDTVEILAVHVSFWLCTRQYGAGYTLYILEANQIIGISE